MNLERLPDGGLAPFRTKKHTYTPLRPGSPIGVARWTEYERLNIMFGFGRTFQQIHEALTNIQTALSSDRPLAEVRADCIVAVASIKKGILDESKERYNLAFYLCTIFIQQDDEDMKTWTHERATAIIKDWEQEGVNEQDLFFFALSASSGLSHAVRLEREAVQRTMEMTAGLGVASTK
jgi:hypothetical protein